MTYSLMRWAHTNRTGTGTGPLVAAGLYVKSRLRICAPPSRGTGTSCMDCLGGGVVRPSHAVNLLRDSCVPRSPRIPDPHGLTVTTFDGNTPDVPNQPPPQGPRICVDCPVVFRDSSKLVHPCRSRSRPTLLHPGSDQFSPVVHQLC